MDAEFTTPEICGHLIDALWEIMKLHKLNKFSKEEQKVRKKLHINILT